MRRAIRQGLKKFCWHSRLLYGLQYAAKVTQMQRRVDGRLAFPYVARRQQPNFQILTYHRLTATDDPFFSGVPVDLFARQIHFLTQHYQVVSLAELLHYLDSGHPIPHNAVAVTFDDGYHDNYELAFPILRRYGVSATIFLTTSFVNRDDVLWNDKVSFALKHTHCQKLTIACDNEECSYPLQTLSERLATMWELLRLLRRVPHLQRLALIDQILKRLDIDDFGELWDSMLTWDHVRQMYQHGISFGAHTVTHPMLSRISIDEAGHEIVQSKRSIENALNAPVELFAYPDGGPTAFNDTVKCLVEAAGFRAAVTTILGTNDVATDRYALRRDCLGDIDLAAFASTLCWQKLMT